MRCLVTGASGYVGGRLVPLLLAEGHEVRCLVRSAPRLRDVPWAADVDIVEGDVTDRHSLAGAFDGIDIVYYLVHALGQADFEDVDRSAAANVAAAAAAAGVARIAYLGGPAPTGPDTKGSAHLRSRAEVAEIFLRSGVPTVVLRAPVIIGSGSASFEMLRYLTERLPVMVTPRWVRTRVQPIAIGDVLRYLVACADPARIPATVSRAFDLGGPDVLTYADMMRRYAAVAGLRPRVIVALRPLTPRLSAYWVGLVTPVPGAIARPLVASLIHEAVRREHDIDRYVPDPADGLTGFDEAVRLAWAGRRGHEWELRQIHDADVPTRWSTAVWPHASKALPTDPQWAGGSTYTDVRERLVAASPERLWSVIEGIGGERGWYSFPLAWSTRGLLDRLVGGVGLRLVRRDPQHLRLGEALDFWRVEQLKPGQLLRLRAEMRLPGRAWLELSAEPTNNGHSRYRQRAIFQPRGLAGHAYWAAISPFHAIVFGGMARNIAQTAEH